MTSDDLKTALEGLTTERVQRLVDRLEADPTVTVTVGAWRPRCPMVLAGFDPVVAAPDAPEIRFAVIWDQVAAARPGHWWTRPVRLSAGRAASRADVQALLRSANRVLATRGAGDPDVQRELTGLQNRPQPGPGGSS